MAAFAQATPAPAAVPTRTRAPSHTKLLPDGPCNHRNTDLGPNAPVCGCQRFWCNDNTTVGGRPVEIPWCVCGHHACFHAAGDPPPASTSLHLENPAPSQATSFAGRLVMADAGAQNQGPDGPVDGSQPGPLWNAAKAGWQHPATPTRNKSGSRGDPARNAPQPPVWATSPRVDLVGANPSPLPSIPSICRLGSSDLRLFDNNPNNSMSTEVVPSPVLPGMGMSMHSTAGELDRVLTTPTFAGAGFHRTLEPHKWREASLDPTIQDSTDGESTRPRPSPSRTFMAQVLARRTAQNSGAPRPVPQALDGAAQSATELATSLENTPDLRSFDHNMQETRDMISNLCESLAYVEKNNGLAAMKREPGDSPDPEGAHASQESRAESLTTSLRNIPLILQRLAPHLNHLHQHLSSYPNVSTDIRDIQSRVLSLENASFQHIPPDEILEKFENFDVRLLELEQRVKDYFAENDLDGSIKDTLVGSDASAYDPEDAIRRLEALEYRLESLEATLPSPSNPWEIEVVLLPWGKDLKGIWFSASEWESGAYTGSQSSEDRAQSVSSLSSIKAQPQLMSAEHFENDAIDRVSNTSQESASLEGWYPRACGRNSVPFKRLESRGFVRRVQIKDSSAGHIQTRICEEFDFLIDLVNTSCRPLEEEDSQMSKHEEENIDLHGLRASILPLRKKKKDSQLLFLGASELVTATLWTAQFLASGVMMRAKGGVKRLYMTHGAAYKQLEMGEEDGWSWESIRRLPRFHPDSNVYNLRAGEADAHDEPCWGHHPNFDPPRDTRASFTSKLSLRGGRNPLQESSSPGFDSQGNESSGSQATAITNNSKAPMTPQSELPSHARSLHPARRFERTLSAPMPQLERQHSYPSASKRRMTVSFHRDDEEEEEEASRRASLETRKRRRFEHSSSPATEAPPSSNASADAHSTSVAIIGAGKATRGAFGYTPRRSREPSSPLRSQATSAGPSTTFAYASRGASVASGRAGSVAAVAGIGACKGADTPGTTAYMTPFSGMAEGGVYDDGGGLADGGDTEVDSSGDEEDDDDMMTDAAAAAATDMGAGDTDAEMREDHRPFATSPDGAGGDTDFEGCSGAEDDDDDVSDLDSDEEMDLVRHFDSDGMECERGVRDAAPPGADETDYEVSIDFPEHDDDDDDDDGGSINSLVDEVGGGGDTAAAAAAATAPQPRAPLGKAEEEKGKQKQGGRHNESSDDGEIDEIDLDDDREGDLWVNFR